MLKNEHYMGRVTSNGKTRTDQDLRISPDRLWHDVLSPQYRVQVT